MLQKNRLEKKSETQAARFNSRQRKASVPKTRKLQGFHSFPPSRQRFGLAWADSEHETRRISLHPQVECPFLWLARKDREKHSLPLSLPHKHCWTRYSEVQNSAKIYLQPPRISTQKNISWKEMWASRGAVWGLSRGSPGSERESRRHLIILLPAESLPIPPAPLSHTLPGTRYVVLTGTGTL